MNSFDAATVARRYDAARELPAQTKALWMQVLTDAIPEFPCKILDLGCGTGRFTRALAETFRCPVVGMEPSAAMLDVAAEQETPLVTWLQGDAENISLENEGVNLVFMSQVFHHLADPPRALQEIRRVLSEDGCLAIRNATRETNEDPPWLRCFPEARVIDDRRLPTRRGLESLVCGQSFTLISCNIVNQLFASTPQQYYDKIKKRGLSALLSIDDDAFERGLRYLQEWAACQPQDALIYESIDFFIFQKAL